MCYFKKNYFYEEVLPKEAITDFQVGQLIIKKKRFPHAKN